MQRQPTVPCCIASRGWQANTTETPVSSLWYKLVVEQCQKLNRSQADVSDISIEITWYCVFERERYRSVHNKEEIAFIFLGVFCNTQMSITTQLSCRFMHLSSVSFAAWWTEWIRLLQLFLLWSWCYHHKLGINQMTSQLVQSFQLWIQKHEAVCESLIHC